MKTPPIIYSSLTGQPDPCWEALQKRDLDFLDRHGQSLSKQWMTDKLIWAARHQSVREVNWLIKHGADVNHDDGRALLDAIWDQKNEIARCLIAHGADLTTYHHAPLRYAAKTGNIELMEVLIRAGASCEKALKCANRVGDWSSVRPLLQRQKQEAERASLIALAEKHTTKDETFKRRI